MRIRPAAGVNGRSTRLTTTIGGANSFSLTLIAVSTFRVSANSLHCTGTIASRSLWARHEISVNADWHRTANFGAGKSSCLNNVPISSAASAVIDIVTQSAPPKSRKEVAARIGWPVRHKMMRSFSNRMVFANSEGGPVQCRKPASASEWLASRAGSGSEVLNLQASGVWRRHRVPSRH